MSVPQTPERPARDGETCSCGRPAVTVYQTAKFGDVPFCGVEGGGHSNPQAPPPCPPWCEAKHPRGRSPISYRPHLYHYGRPFLSGAVLGSVQIEQEWHADTGLARPVVSLLLTGFDAKAVELTAGQARGLAAQMLDPVATALRKAADLLDEITSGGAQ